MCLVKAKIAVLISISLNIINVIVCENTLVQVMIKLATKVITYITYIGLSKV